MFKNISKTTYPCSKTPYKMRFKNFTVNFFSNNIILLITIALTTKMFTSSISKK